MRASGSPGIYPNVVLEGGLLTQESKPTNNEGDVPGSGMASRVQM